MVLPAEKFAFLEVDKGLPLSLLLRSARLPSLIIMADGSRFKSGDIYADEFFTGLLAVCPIGCTWCPTTPLLRQISFRR